MATCSIWSCFEGESRTEQVFSLEQKIKLADYFKIPGVFNLGSIPTWPPSGSNAYLETSVMEANFREYVEIVFQICIQNCISMNGYSFFVVGMDGGQWPQASRASDNELLTTQVYPRSWTMIYMALDNVGMQNVRSENWSRQFSGAAYSWRYELPIPKASLNLDYTVDNTKG